MAATGQRLTRYGTDKEEITCVSNIYHNQKTHSLVWLISPTSHTTGKYSEANLSSSFEDTKTTQLICPNGNAGFAYVMAFLQDYGLL